MSVKAKKAENQQMEVSKSTGMMMTVFFAILSLAFLFPIFLVLVNSFKSKLYISDAPFQLPKAGTYVALTNYFEGVRKTGFFPAFGRSLFITICSVAVIVLFTSMTAWYITRVKSKFNSILYYIFVFAMIVPFQTYFNVVFPMLRPTAVTLAILNAMWIWNDYLLPSLILPQEKGTIPMVIQNLKGGYGSIDMGAMMAMLVLAIVPIIIFYLSCQKYIIKGVAAGAVKG